MKRILILTASFGEGHNTAARSISEALALEGGAETDIADLYISSMPKVNEAVKFSYTVAINRLPKIWNLVFKWLDHPGSLESTLWAGGALRRALDDRVAEFKPDAIVSTYPLYAYLYRRLQRSRLGLRMPFFTVITDSVGVNSAWYRCRSDGFIVADRETAELLASNGVPPDTIHTLGFPVAPTFETLSRIPNDSTGPWKILFMPSTRISFSLRQIEAILEMPDIELTVVAGRHDRLAHAVQESGFIAGGRCSVVGWTNEMPNLLASHHLFVGKAGGAIVQEAIAAHTPFLVSHLVPGQEEGNIALIQRLDVGATALGGPQDLADGVGRVFENGGFLWRKWKHRLDSASDAGASRRIARHLLGPSAAGR